MNDWKEILQAVAPTLATVLGGPLAGAAVGALSTALLGKPGGTEQELAPLIVNANPDILLKIKEADKELKLGLANAGIKLEEISAMDRDSARGREVKTGDKTTKILAYAYTIGYFVIFATMMKTGVSDQMENIVMVLLGVLTAAQAQIMNYYFGSSSGSAQKNDLMAAMTSNKIIHS